MSDAPLPTMMQLFGRRFATCQTCGNRFSRGSNNLQACWHHPGKWGTACPAACERLSDQCRLHYVDRWSCCDSTVPGHAKGCATRRHVEPPTDEELDRRAEATAVAAAKEAQLAEEDWEEVEAAEERLRKLRIGQLQRVQDKHTAQRKTAALEKHLKPG